MIGAAGKPPVVAAEYPGPRTVEAVAFTSDGRNLISAEHDGSVVVWEVLSGQVRREFLGHQAAVKGLAVSADGKKAASVSMDLTALVWDVTGRLQAGRPAARPDAERLGHLWGALSSQDAQKAAQAAVALAASPEQAVELLGTKCRPIPPSDQARLDRLIADLDSEQFETRVAAEQELGRLGRAAEPALRKALKGSSSAEQRRRIEHLLEPFDAATVPHQEVVDARAVEVLEWIGTAEAQRVLNELARGAPGARLTEEAEAARRRLKRESPGGR
jgi:WD40 repeat protein